MKTIRKYAETGYDYRALTDAELDALAEEARLAAGHERRRAIADFASLLWRAAMWR